MNELYNMLPNDLIFIIEDYAKDTTNYEKVIKQFLQTRNYALWNVVQCHDYDWPNEDIFCAMFRNKDMYTWYKWNLKECIRNNKKRL